MTTIYHELGIIRKYTYVSTLSGKLFIQMRKNSGSKAKPSGTPLFTFAQLEQAPQKSILVSFQLDHFLS